MLSELRLLVSSQQLVINKLEGHVDFLLSFLGIAEMQTESAIDGDSHVSVNGPRNAPRANLGDHGASGEDKDLVSWSNVAKRRRGNRRDVLQHDTFQQSVVAARFALVDQTVEKHCETSIIVNGLSSNKSAPDSELFTAL